MKKSEPMLFEELKFYNKQQKFIAEDDLASIKKKVEKEGRLYWANKAFAENSIAFYFYKKKFDVDSMEYSSKKEKKEALQDSMEIFVELHEFPFKFTVKQMKDMKHLLKGSIFLGFPLDDEQIKAVNSMLPHMSEECEALMPVDEKGFLAKMFNSPEEVVDVVIKSGTLKSKQFSGNFDEFRKVTKFLYGIDLVFPKSNCISDSYNPSIFRIFDVLEKRIDDKNYRISFEHAFNNGQTGNFHTRIYTEEDKDYNYVDKGALYIYTSETRYFLDNSLLQYNDAGTFVTNLDTLEEMEDYLPRIVGNGKRIISPSIFKFYDTKVKRFNKIRETKITDEKEIQIAQKYEELLKKDMTIKIEELSISKIAIKLSDGAFSIEFDPSFINVPDHIAVIRKAITAEDARYNFNELWVKLLALSSVNILQKGNASYDEYKEFKEARFKINGMNIHITKSDTGRIHVNDAFCRVTDLQDILERAVCYTDLKDYKKYIKDVAHIGLDMKRIINNGLILHMDNPFFGKFDGIEDINQIRGTEKMHLRFSMVWDSVKRNKVFLHLNGKMYLIKYKGKFKKFFNMPQRNVGMSELKHILMESLDNFEEDTIIEIVENAIQEGKIVQERALKLLADTIRDIKAEEVEELVGERMTRGYLIKGNRTGKMFFVDGMKLDVYRKDDGKWNRRCVVSDPNKNRIFEDRLANRLVNIYNENPNIRTIQ